MTEKQSESAVRSTWAPKYSEWIEEDYSYPYGWRVCDHLGSGDTIAFDDRDCRFASKADCELACKSLNDEGVTIDDVMDMSGEQFGKLVTRYLRW